MKLGKHRLQNALRRRDLARNRLVVRGDELGRPRVTDQAWTATPSKPVGVDLAVSEPLRGPVQALKMNACAHLQPTRSSAVSDSSVVPLATITILPLRGSISTPSISISLDFAPRNTDWGNVAMRRGMAVALNYRYRCNRQVGGDVMLPGRRPVSRRRSIARNHVDDPLGNPRPDPFGTGRRRILPRTSSRRRPPLPWRGLGCRAL